MHLDVRFWWAPLRLNSSDQLSGRLRAEPVRRLLQLALVRDHYLRANNMEEDGRLIADLVPFNEPIEKISADALRKFIAAAWVDQHQPG